MTRRRRRTSPTDPGNVQQLFPFYDAMPDTPTPDVDDARFEPDPADIRKVDGFVLHQIHATRLAEVRSFHRRPRLGEYIARLLESFESDVPENAGEQ